MEKNGYSVAINRDSPIPVYYQIELDLKKRITKGEWAIHQSLPSESELATQYDVSRITLRQALAELEKDGIIKKYRGKAAIINAVPSPFVHDLSYTLVSGRRMTQESYGKNTMTAKVLQLERLVSTFPEIHESLKLRDNEKVIYMKRLFLLDKKPIAIGKSWLPDSLVPKFAEDGLIDNSLSKTLVKRYGITPVRVEDYLDVVRPTQSEYELLRSTYDAPLILIKGISYLSDGRPVEYSQTAWLGDKVRFHFTLHHTDQGFVMGP
ncbi:GntR family transcriptional regulator [Breznakiella homolactica]|uniref:GntR family transcriptional regulator n=1 Tax=Breznakiella homolactica TaxID=2798577 RepID=A0A7T8B9M2_9SPIR|nr:GntR family transcriptional regulator [Breznakiella homolactica]QQO08451.1 GntR family transcriptional regulator [Breznakiella homolactica]